MMMYIDPYGSNNSIPDNEVIAHHKNHLTFNKVYGVNQKKEKKLIADILIINNRIQG